MYSDHEIKQIAGDLLYLLDQYGTDSQSLWQQFKNDAPAAIGMLKFIKHSAYGFLLLGVAVGTGHAEILKESSKHFAQGGQDALHGLTADIRRQVAEFRTDSVDWPTFAAQVEAMTHEPLPDITDPDRTALRDYLRRHFPS